MRSRYCNSNSTPFFVKYKNYILKFRIKTWFYVKDTRNFDLISNIIILLDTFRETDEQTKIIFYYNTLS